MGRGKICSIILYHTFAQLIATAVLTPSEDIPIQFFKLGEYDEGNIDHEILGRTSRTVLDSESPNLKQYFLSSLTGSVNPAISKSFDADLPKPGGFVASKGLLLPGMRGKRQTSDDPLDTEAIHINSDIEEELGRTSEVFQSTPMTTELTTSSTEKLSAENYPVDNFISVDDFLRFRRDLNKDSEQKIESFEIQDNTDSEMRSKRDSKTLKKSTKISLEKEDSERSNNRELRDSTRQGWIKLPYQVQRNFEDYDGHHSSPSDHAKPPEVHFVTQRRSDIVDNPISYRNDRRGRNYAELPREARSYMGNSREPFGPRYPRRYEFLPPFPQSRYNSRSRDFRDDYMGKHFVDNRRFNTPPPLQPVYPDNRQKRIIYYANLPEITRTPQSSYYEDRFRYKNIPNERFLNPYQVKPYIKPKFRENDMRESLYPVKISTNVDVREIKKNPERRFYADVDRKSNFNEPPFTYNDDPTRT